MNIIKYYKFQSERHKIPFAKKVPDFISVIWYVSYIEADNLDLMSIPYHYV